MNLKEDYFSNKNQIALYINSFGSKFASTLVLTFTGLFFIQKELVYS